MCNFFQHLISSLLVQTFSLALCFKIFSLYFFYSVRTLILHCKTGQLKLDEVCQIDSLLGECWGLISVCVCYDKFSGIE